MSSQSNNSLRDRLTEAQRAKVLELLALGLTKADVARRFGVSDATILKIWKQANAK